MVKVQGVWLQRRELSSRAITGKRPWTFKREYGHEIAVHKASEIMSEELSQCQFALINSGDISEPVLNIDCGFQHFSFRGFVLQNE